MNRSIDKTHDTVSKGKTHDQLKRSVQSVRGIPKICQVPIPKGNSKNICQVATSIDINQPFRSESFHVRAKGQKFPGIQEIAEILSAANLAFQVKIQHKHAASVADDELHPRMVFC